MTEPTLYRNEGLDLNKNVHVHMPVVFWTIQREVNSFQEAVDAKLLHQNNGREAVRWANGDKEWFRFGRYHRDDGKPSFEGSNGARGWSDDGLAHRDGDPACIDAEGKSCWFQRGYLHREDGPAITELDGAWAFIDYDRTHRARDLPAMFYFDHDDGLAVVEWQILGAVDRQPSLGPAAICYWPDGSWHIEYWRGGVLHNDLGPSVISVHANGEVDLSWHLDGIYCLPEKAAELPGVEALQGLPPLKPMIPQRRRQQLLEEVSAGVGSLDSGNGGVGLITPLRHDQELHSAKDILEVLSGQTVNPAVTSSTTGS
jgi:hypothetical protein